METDRHYFFEGLFIIVFSVAAAFFAVWLGSPGRQDDLAYRIRFDDSVSGLAVGDPVKFRGRRRRHSEVDEHRSGQFAAGASSM